MLARNLIRYSHEYYPSLVLAPILPFSDTGPNSTTLRYSPGYYLSRYSLGPFFGTRPYSTCLRYWPKFYHSPLLAWILRFPVLDRILLRYSPGFYPSPILKWILTFSGTGPNYTILRYSPRYHLSRYSPGPFFGIRTDSTPLRYSQGFYPSLVLA